MTREHAGVPLSQTLGTGTAGQRRAGRESRGESADTADVKALALHVISLRGGGNAVQTTLDQSCPADQIGAAPIPAAAARRSAYETRWPGLLKANRRSPDTSTSPREEGVPLSHNQGSGTAGQSQPSTSGLPEPTRSKPTVITIDRKSMCPEEAFQERAAIIEHDGGAAREWAEAFARIETAPPPRGFTRPDWLDLLNNAGLFLDKWAAKAAALGWTPADVFGIRPKALGSWYGFAGVLPGLGKAKIVEILGDRAIIEQPTGGRQTFYRRELPDACAVWEMSRPDENRSRE